MHKSFSFKGINRSTDLLLASEGECVDVVNLRMSNGCLCPMPQPVPCADLPGVYSAVYTHSTTGFSVAITSDMKKTLHFFDSNWKQLESDGKPLEFDGLREVIGLEFLGNVVCCMTTRGIHYLLFEKDSYRLLGERPAIPAPTVSVTSKVEIVMTENNYNAMTDTDELENTWSYNEKGYIDEAISILNKSGHYIDRALFRVALRLYDGSYVNCSNVIYVSDEESGDAVARDAFNLVSDAVSADSYTRFKVYVRGFKVDFTFDTAELANWRNIVVGIDVFSTSSIMGKKCALEGRVYKFERYVAKELDELWKDVAGASLYYKIAEYDVDGKLLHRVDDVSPVNLALQEGMGSLEMPASLSSIVANCSYVYNGRLHIGALREHFFQGYNAHVFHPVGGDESTVNTIVQHIKIRTTNGDFVVCKNYIAPQLGYDGYNHELPPLLMYPDSRAFEMTLFVVIDGVAYRKTFPLQPHDYLNYSFYLHKWYSPYSVSQLSSFASGGSASKAPADVVLKVFNYEVGEHRVVYDSTKLSWVYNGKTFPPEEYKTLRAFAVPRNVKEGDSILFTIERRSNDYSFKDIYNVPIDSTWEVVETIPELEESSVEERPNVVKVSMVENPFVFSASCTYTPSQGRVIGISSNTSTMSQGQFGQFPLYVFCSDGIWAMQVDTSGSIAYLTSHQVSRDICVNEKSICGITGGVVFVGKQGVMLVTGNSAKKISLAMESNFKPMQSVPECLFTDIASIVSLNGNLGEEDFRTFITKATVSYLHSHNELLISNASYGYSYVCSFDSGFWSRYSAGFAGKVYGRSDTLLLLHKGDTTSLSEISDNVAGSNRVLLYTRPLLWGTKLPKRIMQLMLHACVDPVLQPTMGVPALACYMLCSNDGVHFKLITGSEKSERCRDVLFPYFPTQSYRYYLFAIVGEMGEGSAIAGMDIELSPAWNNKLR